jgi:hypothetical protein
VSGLAHYFEQEGIATGLISLFRPHTEKIKPPRALWVPFELGRPLGAPGNPGFQHRVLAALLDLFSRTSGPVLADFDEDAPGESIGEEMAWACPVDFGSDTGKLSPTDRLKQSVRAEISQLATWHDLALKKHGRTTMGPSGMYAADIGEFLCGFLQGGQPDNPHKDLDLPWSVKLASEDLKAYYFEAAMAKPGAAPLGSQALQDWFWGMTSAGELLLELKTILSQSDDKTTQLLGSALIVPTSQAHRQDRA